METRTELNAERISAKSATPAVERRLVAVIRGRAYFEVLVDQRPVFTGSLSECERFERMHEEKETDARRDKRRRDKPEAKIYRIHGRMAAAGGF